MIVSDLLQQLAAIWPNINFYFYLFREEPLSLRFCDYASNNMGLLGHLTISHLQIDCCIVEEFSEC